ncbi:MAG: flagellin FliC [Myxococcales bacterium]|nr:flagellin FliC [Myxococcales bacterium]
MPLVVNTNVASLDAQKSLARTSQALQKSFQRLSSGFRINSASDDAAGLAVSESLKSRIKSFAVAERNTSNAISMAKTAEGGLSEISGIVIRMRELAVQAANGDLTSTDRSYIDTEFTALKSEITRLADSTEYNGKELLAGSTTAIAFQVGIGTATAQDTISVDFGNISLSTLSLSGASVGGSSQSNATTAIASIDSALNSVSNSRATFGAAINRLGIALSNSQTIRTNLEAANSAIRDVDIAEESSILARSQVLLQAGTSVLAQANQAPSLALSLLG